MITRVGWRDLRLALLVSTARYRDSIPFFAAKVCREECWLRGSPLFFFVYIGFVGEISCVLPIMNLL